MKVAVCFSGQIRTANECAPNLKRFFSSKKHEIDFFIHTWDNTSYKNFNGTNIYPQRTRLITSDEIDFLKETYNPKILKIESHLGYLKKYVEKGFGNGLELWYSFYKSIILKRWYERKYNFKYDIVIKLRPDCMFKNVDAFDKHIDYILSKSGNTMATHFRYSSEWTSILNTISANDIFFISNSKTMDSYSTFFIDKMKYDKSINPTYCKNDGYGYTQYMHTFFKNINPIQAFDEPFVLRDAYKHLAKEEISEKCIEKISEADGYYYSYYKLNPNGNFYVYELSNEVSVDFDDMDNLIYLNEN